MSPADRDAGGQAFGRSGTNKNLATMNMSQSMYQQQNRQNYKISQEIKVKLMIKGILEGKFVTILMCFVTIFALVGVS
jgi:exopolyphosphatase/pppGpp-phosphohydrolase